MKNLRSIATSMDQPNTTNFRILGSLCTAIVLYEHERLSGAHCLHAKTVRHEKAFWHDIRPPASFCVPVVAVDMLLFEYDQVNIAC